MLAREWCQAALCLIPPNFPNTKSVSTHFCFSFYASFVLIFFHVIIIQVPCTPDLPHPPLAHCCHPSGKVNSLQMWGVTLTTGSDRQQRRWPGSRCRWGWRTSVESGPGPHRLVFHLADTHLSAAGYSNPDWSATKAKGIPIFITLHQLSLSLQVKSTTPVKHIQPLASLYLCISYCRV